LRRHRRSVGAANAECGRDHDQCGTRSLHVELLGLGATVEGDTLSLLATDRYRMVLKEISWNPGTARTDGAALVPARVQRVQRCEQQSRVHQDRRPRVPGWRGQLSAQGGTGS